MENFAISYRSASDKISFLVQRFKSAPLPPMYLEILRIVGAENKIISLYETISNIRYNDVILYLFKWSFPPEDNYGHSTLKVVIAFTYAQACALVLANYLPYLENIERVRAGMVVC